MSVPRSKRGVSEAEFLHTARELQIFTLRRCKHIPKRYTFLVAKPLTNSAASVYEMAKSGNSIYPRNQHEAQLRRDYFNRAVAGVYSLVSQVEVCREMFSIPPDMMLEWMRLCKQEIELLKGVMDSDRRRYKALPD